MRGGIRWWVIRLLMGRHERLLLKEAVYSRFHGLCYGKVTDAREQGEDCLAMMEKLTQ